MTVVENFRNLPAGTRLRFHTEEDNILDIEVVEAIDTPRYGMAVNVKVLGDHRELFQGPDSVVMQAADFSRLGRPVIDTSDYGLNLVADLEPGIDLVFDDHFGPPCQSKIVSVEVVAT